ncbi:conserved hypothetical protein [Theileria orientalis strain Shintoku]|uniref:Uncharacterized protein n=1 Tax=Theileria orientalis strain Shintoku TaxID=869250 RepID=J4DPH8_THEOR|nr:conserved hypothetical protein [Theileria orientalis strain Shintoku]BAM40729.1 conserved hypothetical protein [Theileria orientalis strain Shintoku]|eukprot:XP_009691030.1 conserved hypothetical protein [Theileria orientalis strain Shintoku]
MTRHPSQRWGIFCSTHSFSSVPWSFSIILIIFTIYICNFGIMNSLFVALFAVATVSASPFVFDDHLVKDGSPKLSVFHHVSSSSGSGSLASKLRFLHLVPAADHLSAFSEGLASAHFSGSPKVHPPLKPDSDEKLVELLGLSDCSKFHAAVVSFFSSASSSVFTKFLSWEKDKGASSLSSLSELVDFVHVHVDLALKSVFSDLVRKGLSAHVFTHALHSKLS